jgi:mono/diheme cytochrome c family protein
MRKYIFITLVFLMAGLLSACGSDPRPAPAPTETGLPSAEPQATASPVTAAPTFPAATLSPTPAPVAGLPDGAALVQEYCTECHSLNRVKRTSGTAAQWASIVEDMIAEGLEVTEQEKQTIIAYLAQTYP